MGLDLSVMEQPMIDYVRDQLASAKGSWPKIAKETGVAYGTLKRIYYDVDSSPRLENVEPLYNYFTRKAA